MADTATLRNFPSGQLSIQASEALDNIAGFSVFSQVSDGTSKGAIPDIVLAAGLACFGSSGSRPTKEETDFSKSLKPKMLIASIQSTDQEKQDAALKSMADHAMSRDFILKNASKVRDAAYAMGTHSDKLTNASGPYGVLMEDEACMQQSMPTRGLCSGTFDGRSRFSASANAALSAAMRFLSWSVVMDGRKMSLLEATEHWSDIAIEHLGEDVHTLMLETLATFREGRKAASRLSPTSEHKVLLWPKPGCTGEDDQYVCISPVVSFSMLGEVERRLRDMQRVAGPDRKFVHRREITVGGSKPQNIGLVAMDASGSFKRLMSQPMPPPTRNLAWAVKNDRISLSPRSISSQSMAAFKNAVDRETSQDNADNVRTTNNLISAMVLECVSELLGAHELSLNGASVGVKTQVLLADLVSRRGQGFDALVEKCVGAMFRRMGKMKFGADKEAFAGSDAQKARFMDVVRHTLEGAVQ